jgi:hypothetical protein
MYQKGPFLRHMHHSPNFGLQEPSSLYQNLYQNQSVIS